RRTLRLSTLDGHLARRLGRRRRRQFDRGSVERAPRCAHLARQRAMTTAMHVMPEVFGRPRRPLRPQVAAGLLALVALAAGVVPLVTDPNAQNLDARLAAPSWHHPFGTDALGRDTAARVFAGARVSLAVAALSTLVSVLVGATLGLWAGYRGGRVDAVVSYAV